MRVITGTARGRKLTAPEGMDVRPTTDMAKEGMFSAIQFEIEGALALDLFAGSGQLGIEAMSRGARGAVFVDQSRASRQAVEQNLRHTGFWERARLVAGDAKGFLLSCREQFDLAFLDPPYDQGLIPECLPLLAEKMAPGGIILCETSRGETLPEQAGRFCRSREYHYGKSKVTIYREKEGR